MQTLQLYLMRALVKLLAPASPAYGNALAFERPQTCEELKAKLKPGDVIFSRTNTLLYEVSRKFMGMKYDHVAVILNDKEVIHISPPIISKIDMEYIMNPSRQPLIIRPNIEDLDKFLTVIQSFLGEKYNISDLPKFALNQIRSKLQMIKNKSVFSLANLKYSRVCSDSILYSLCRGSPKIKQLTEKFSRKGRFQQLGFFLPDEVADILLENNSEIILKSSFKQQYKLVETIAAGEEGIMNFFKKIKSMVSSQEKQNNEGYKNKMKKKAKLENLAVFQIISFVLMLAQVMGFSVNNKIQFIMIIMNTIMMIGYFGQIKSISKHISPKL